MMEDYENDHKTDTKDNANAIKTRNGNGEHIWTNFIQLKRHRGRAGDINKPGNMNSRNYIGKKMADASSLMAQWEKQIQYPKFTKN